MTVGAHEGGIIKVFRMLELLAVCAELEEFGAFPLRKDGMASIAVVGLNRAFPVFGFVATVMAPETARPVSVADVVRIDAPIGLHGWKEIVGVNLLNEWDGLADAGVIRVAIGQKGGDPIASLYFGLVRASEDVNGVGLDIGQRAIDVAQRDGQIDGVVGGCKAVGGPVVAVHAVHPPGFVLADLVGEG